MCRVRERAKNVEDRANTNLASRRADMFHRGMVSGSKHEAEASLSHAVCHLFRAEIDAYTERFKHIRTAAAAGSGAVAMLGDKCACSGSQNTRTCRDIEGTRTISACTAGIHGLRRGILIQVYLHGLFAHYPRHARDFLDGFTALAQPQRR